MTDVIADALCNVVMSVRFRRRGEPKEAVTRVTIERFWETKAKKHCIASY